MFRTSTLEFKSPYLINHQNSSSISPNKPFKRKSSLLKSSEDPVKQAYHINSHKIPNSIYYGYTTQPSKQQSMTITDRVLNHSDQSKSYSTKLKKSISSYSVNMIKHKNKFLTHNNQNKKYDYQLLILNKEIQKLKKDILMKDNQIKTLKVNKLQFKEIEMELIQTYRVINYMQGKLKQQQKIIIFHQGNYDKIEKQANPKIKQGLDFKQIIQYFRNQSIQLRAQLQKCNYELIKSTNRVRDVDNKCFKLQKQINQFMRKSQKDKINSIYNTRLQGYKQKISARNTDQQFSVSSSVRTKSLKSGSGQYKVQRYMPFSPRLIENNGEKLQMSKLYGNFNSKLNKIQKQLDYFKVQTEKIQMELNYKVKQNCQLRLQIEQLKTLLKSQNKLSEKQQNTNQIIRVNSDKLNKVSILPKSFNFRKKQDSITTTESKKVDNLDCNPGKKTEDEKYLNMQNQTHNKQQKKYTFEDIRWQTVRKLRFNLIREDITYVKLIDILTNTLVDYNSSQIAELFTDIPYQLSSQQAIEFLNEGRKILQFIKKKQDQKQPSSAQLLKQNLKSILQNNISPYKNITIRRDASLNSQISKIFKNRVDELQEYLSDQQSHQMQFESAHKIFNKQWFLSQQEIDFIFLKSCEQSQQFRYFNFPKTINFFLEN